MENISVNKIWYQCATWHDGSAAAGWNVKQYVIQIISSCAPRHWSIVKLFLTESFTREPPYRAHLIPLMASHMLYFSLTPFFFLMTLQPQILSGTLNIPITMHCPQPQYSSLCRGRVWWVRHFNSMEEIFLSITY